MAAASPPVRWRPHPADLLAQVLSALVDRSSLDPALVDDVLIGCVGGAGEQSATPGRQALLAAGWPTSVPSVTIERKCGSGQQAVEFAAAGIVAGLYDIAVAGGGVDEPGPDGVGADGRGSVRRRRGSDSRSSCRRASRPSSSRSGSASAVQLDEHRALARAGGIDRVDGGFKDEIAPSSPAVRR